MKPHPAEPAESSQKHGLLASRDRKTTPAVQYRLAWLHMNRWNFVIALVTLSFLMERNGPDKQAQIRA